MALHAVSPFPLAVNAQAGWVEPYWLAVPELSAAFSAVINSKSV